MALICFSTYLRKQMSANALIKTGKPEWDLLGLTGVEELPAVKWKLMNIKKMEKKKHKKALEKLRNYLEK